MKYGLFIFALVFILKDTPVSAFEARTPERDESGLRIELEPVPSQVQQDFDRYVKISPRRRERTRLPKSGRARMTALKNGRRKSSTQWFYSVGSFCNRRAPRRELSP